MVGGELEQGFALAWDGHRELSSEMISSVASVVGLHANETRTALGERWSDKLGDLCMRCTLLPGRANEGRYVSRLRQRGDGSNTARTTIHVCPVPSCQWLRQIIEVIGSDCQI